MTDTDIGGGISPRLKKTLRPAKKLSITAGVWTVASAMRTTQQLPVRL